MLPVVTSDRFVAGTGPVLHKHLELPRTSDQLSCVHEETWFGCVNMLLDIHRTKGMVLKAGCRVLVSCSQEFVESRFGLFGLLAWYQFPIAPRSGCRQAQEEVSSN